MLVIGNGESRKSIDLTRIDCPKIGCNAVYRDYYTDYLVCVDKRMFKEALELNINLDRFIYTRQEHHKLYQKKKTRIVPELPYAGMERPDDPFHWGSGPYAVLIAAKISKESQVSLLGFDLYGIDNKINNIYKDTSNYQSGDKRAVDPSYWIYQIAKVITYFPKVKFTIYQEDGWQCPKAWKKSNVKVDKISNIYYNT